LDLSESTQGKEINLLNPDRSIIKIGEFCIYDYLVNFYGVNGEFWAGVGILFFASMSSGLRHNVFA